MLSPITLFEFGMVVGQSKRYGLDTMLNGKVQPYHRCSTRPAHASISLNLHNRARAR